MNPSQIYEDILKKISDIDQELAKKLMYLKQYRAIYTNNSISFSEKQKARDSVNLNGKTIADYFAGMPKYNDFQSPKNFYIAQSRYRLETYKNAIYDEKFAYDYNRLSSKGERFFLNATKLSLGDVKKGNEAFARDIVNLCASYNLPYLDTFRHVDDLYKIFIKRAMNIIKENNIDGKSHKM